MYAEEILYSKREADVVVHINQRLDKHHRADIEEAVESETGVRQARFNDRHNHLMIVAYDPKMINSATILNSVKHQKVNAQLIGGI